jgi:light-regulated signal transduction histidine kinase (bacteriophytochrome)
MHDLINDLLDYSRVSRNSDPMTTTDAGVVLGQVLVGLQKRIVAAGATVTHDTLPIILVDERQLAIIFQNLIENAIKFRNEHPPHVHISAMRIGREWRFSVVDNGIGIAPEYYDRIFVIFQRLHARDAYPGTGIGLSIVKRIIEGHGGRIWVESEQGQGSTFFFTLPDHFALPGKCI